MDLTAARLHARLTSTARRWERATHRITDHLAAHPDSYVSWSGGKDSTATAIAATAVDPGVPVIRLSEGCDFPELVVYCADVAAGWNYHVVALCDLDEHLRRVAADLGLAAYDPSIIEGPRAGVTAAVGTVPDGIIWGLRAEESTARRWNGISRDRADGQTTCAPLYDWSAADVYAYLAIAGVPPCPVYDRLVEVGAPPGAQRVGHMVEARGIPLGQLSWLRAGWPGEWARLVERAPWLGQL